MRTISTRRGAPGIRAIVWIHEYIGDLIIFTACILVGYLIVTLVPLSVEWGRSAKASPSSAIDVYSKAFAFVISCAGLAVAYRKYVRGRLFSERADLTLIIRPVRWNIPAVFDRASLLHESTVQIRNTGAVAIWLPEIMIHVLALDGDRTVSDPVSAGNLVVPRPLFGVEAIEPGATYVSTYWFRVPIITREFRVSVDVQSLRGTAWHRTSIIANSFTDNDDELRGVLTAERARTIHVPS